MNDLPTPLQRITLGGGCFWCLEAVFERVRGVAHVESGYCNGESLDPSYEQVCSGNSGHAEVVRIDFDPAQVSLVDLLHVFFAIHDPTTLNRQGADVGSQYRSGIYVHGDAQLTEAQQVLAEVRRAYPGQVVTELMPERNYWPAEGYHQHYYANHPEQAYCAFVVAAKVDKFTSTFKRLLRD
ncbi:peptide-methionine (S)-S-oxide reductase MsrA [Roseateles koreensis]|uniref:Peptide methionine sulfoxide reductase MsrA n=1 Tax=Roseateles koreensis TaxID=2987526 RepID=A0ABT5KVG7_9BURK|nr:peptide-methionine (S)-S-oxide reductase MsrA [Roseateles koreensis]MDC8786933.1 peptide-methionine (S)-S-oxide reductase MsrA [Roseateles koreensis]